MRCIQRFPFSTKYRAIWMDIRDDHKPPYVPDACMHVWKTHALIFLFDVLAEVPREISAKLVVKLFDVDPLVQLSAIDEFHLTNQKGNDCVINKCNFNFIVNFVQGLYVHTLCYAWQADFHDLASLPIYTKKCRAVDNFHCIFRHVAHFD